MRLYLTATGRYVGTQAEARADGKDWTPEEVPTDKAGLIAYLNRLTLVDPTPTTASTPLDDIRQSNTEEARVKANVLMNQPLTQAKVDEMFEPRATRPVLARDAVCDIISRYEGTDLGYVALEVAARYTALSKETTK